LGKLRHALRRRLVAKPAQHLQSEEDGEGTGQLADEVFNAVINPFAAPASAQLVPFDKIPSSDFDAFERRETVVRTDI